MKNQIFDAPHAREAEYGLLGSIIRLPLLYHKAATKITGNDFYFVPHQYIWDAMNQISNRSEEIDIVTLISELRSTNNVDNAGGEVYILNLPDKVPDGNNIDSYISIVKDRANRREMMKAADKIVEAAVDGENSSENIVLKAEELISDATKNSPTRRFLPVENALNSYFDELQTVMKSEGDIIGIPSGFAPIDNLLSGFHDSDLIVVAGRTGMGKTSWLISTAMNMAREKAKTAFFSLEMSAEQVVQRMIAVDCGISVNQLRRGKLSKEEYTRVLKSMERIHNLTMYIDDTGGISVQELKRKSKQMAFNVGLDVIVVDYIQLMSAGDRHKGSRREQIGYVTESLKNLAKELKVPIIAAAQLNRNVEQRTDKKPQLSDLRESGTIEQDADVVMFLYRESYYERENDQLSNIAQVIFAKNRHGPTKNVELVFNGPLTRFENVIIKPVQEGGENG